LNRPRHLPRRKSASVWASFIHLLSILIFPKRGDTFSLLPALPFLMTGWSLPAPESVYWRYHMCKSHDFLCTILPPHILKKLAESEKHRERALRTIALTEHTRGRRAIIRALLPAIPSDALL